MAVTSTAIALAQETDAVMVSAQAALLDAWMATSALPAARRERAMIAAVDVIVASHGRVATDAAVSYLRLDYLRRGLPQVPELMVAPEIGVDRSVAAASWALQTQKGGLAGPEAGGALRRLQGVLPTLVLSQSRETIHDTGEAHGSRTRTAVARVSEPGACAFCLMLSSRGAVYGNAKLAGEGRKYHDHCRCSTVLASVDGSDLPSRSARDKRLWDEAVAELGRVDDANEFARWLRSRK